MSLSGSGLSAAIKSKIESIFGSPQDDTRLQEFCDAVGDAVVEYLTANTVVTTVGADPQGGSVSSIGTIS